jgi:hypothetical protein
LVKFEKIQHKSSKVQLFVDGVSIHDFSSVSAKHQPPELRLPSSSLGPEKYAIGKARAQPDKKAQSPKPVLKAKAHSVATSRTSNKTYKLLRVFTFIHVDTQTLSIQFTI